MIGCNRLNFEIAFEDKDKLMTWCVFLHNVLPLVIRFKAQSCMCHDLF